MTFYCRDVSHMTELLNLTGAELEYSVVMFSCFLGARDSFIRIILIVECT